MSLTGMTSAPPSQVFKTVADAMGSAAAIIAVDEPKLLGSLMAAGAATTEALAVGLATFRGSLTMARARSSLTP
jgi:hypothetical protein